ncbi:MAG TPA: amidohydrolase family protein [Gemmataceae bacterium]|nr:amidohydrolase family protein [Gemmataceae bacterium]
MKIDIFNHLFPPGFVTKFTEVAAQHGDMVERVRRVPLLTDLDARFRLMDEFGEYCQIISLASPPIEAYAGPDISPLLARLANDGMAEFVRRYPDRFPGFVASLPMNNPDAAAVELDRAMRDLGARGVQIFTNAAGRPLDHPDFAPLFERMAHYDLPVFLHPARGAEMQDYASEPKSRYEIWWTFGWPYETSTAMARLVFSGLFDKFPNIKIIAHHLGAMIPYFANRMQHGWAQLGKRTTDEDYSGVLRGLRKPLLDYFHMFYGDTALFGSASGTRCGLDFFGAEHVLFASDMPFDPQPGLFIRETIRALESLGLDAKTSDLIYRRNAERLLKL